ncbi:aldehyde dehydrogenase family protein [Alphaproteobacteria bacterium]|nr:aldehyde dehydrogenase family protein [Alphaproteobacteria bacterium]
MTKTTDAANGTGEIDLMVEAARTAQAKYEAMGSQALFDKACQAVAWVLMEPERNKTLAALAVAETGLGRVDDKIRKNHNKTLGLMRDLRGVTAFGHVGDNAAKGLSTYLRPKGVIAAIVPSTNPLATPVNNMINALKTGNAIILAPSPKGVKPLTMMLEHIHGALAKLGLPDNLVQMVPAPPSRAKTERLMKLADLVVVTGSQNNVRAGYASGTPAIGVGAGNVVTIIDETADLDDAAAKIAASKTFDNATSCSSENAVVAVDAVYDDVIAALARQGGYLLNAEEVARLEAIHWHDGKMTTTILAQDIEIVLEAMGLVGSVPENTKFLVAPQSAISPDIPMTGEKMARFLSLHRANDFDQAVEKAVAIQSYQGAGHSLGLHSADDTRAHRLAQEAKTCRVIVNQAHCFATGGFFNNGMPFSLTMGCGSWGGNSIDDNLNWEHFVNRVNVVRVIPEDKPDLEEIFGDYWESHGK